MIVEDSDRRCPFCSKRMILDIGQEEMEGHVVKVHSCWSCGYKETEEQWPTTLPTRSDAARERLLKLRNGGNVVPDWIYGTFGVSR